MQPLSLEDARTAVVAAEQDRDEKLEAVNLRYRAGESRGEPAYDEADQAFRTASAALAAAERAEHQALLRSLAGSVIAKVEIFDAPDRYEGVYEQEFYRLELADGRVLEFHGDGCDEWTCRLEQIS